MPAPAANRLLLLGSPPFVPSSIANLVLWLEADKIAGVADGGSVATWADASPSKEDATGGTSPTLAMNAVNGKPAVRFNGTTQNLVNTTCTKLDGLAGATALYVFATNAPGSERMGFDSAERLNLDLDASLIYPGFNGSVFGQAAFSSTAPQVYSIVFDGSQTGNANRLKARLGGAQLTLAFTGTVGSALGSATGYHVGRQDTAALKFWNRDIAAIIYWSRALSVAELQRAERAYGKKYGVAVA